MLSFNQLYIDPATGSMLFSILLGIFVSAGFFFRLLLIKLKSLIGGKAANSKFEKHSKYLLYTDDKRYWNSFMPILDEFEKRKIDVSFWTSSEDDPVFSKKYKYVHPEFIGTGNKAFIKLNAARADVLLSTTPGLDVLQWKRSKGVKKYVHFFHDASTALHYRMFQLDFYDVVLTSSELQSEEVRTLENERKLPNKEIKVVGLPYFDVLAERIKGANKSHKANKVVLLAPSWGKSCLLYTFGEELIDRLIDTGYEIVLRPHPQSFSVDNEIIEKLKAKYDNCLNFKWNMDNDNFDILNESDVLISDFSGVIFDFSFVFGKPVLYTSVSDFDDSVYDSAWIKDELWKFKVLPSIGREISKDNIDNVKSLIDDIINSKEFEKGILEARDYAWKNRGHAASSIVEYLLELQSNIVG